MLRGSDAVHFVIPTGGLGLSSGMGDAIDLAWKLEATLKDCGEALEILHVDHIDHGVRRTSSIASPISARRSPFAPA
jgi:2-polyprenyl-6-methoxyphenol hydroxylase-like FAD-dependent oxidoreductase